MPIYFFRNKTFLFVVRSLRYSGYLINTDVFVKYVAGISKRSNDKQKSFIPKKNRKITKNLFFWIVTRVSARDYRVSVSCKGFQLEFPFSNECFQCMFPTSVSDMCFRWVFQTSFLEQCFWQAFQMSVSNICFQWVLLTCFQQVFLMSVSN